MALIDLKTNLKSLKYGDDRPGGGSSGQPYIVTPIPDGLTANGPDFLLRQGALKASLVDNERLLKWFSDPLSVRGLLFTTKQIALERQNPAIPGGLNRIYLPTNTLSQALLSPEGFHLNKQGLDPFELSYAQGGTKGYFNYTLNKDTLENVSRLSLLYSTKIAKSPPSSLRTAQEKEFNISSNSEFSLSYSGGPNSVGGLGRTNIKLAGNGKNTSRDRTNLYKPVSDLVSNPNQVYTFDNDLLVQQTPFVERKITSLGGLTDYRQVINDTFPTEVLPSTEYASFNRETTYGTSATTYILNLPALRNPNKSVSKETSDKINLSYAQSQQSAVDEGLFESDLIRFFFEVINPMDSSVNSEYLFFRAYLTNIGDSFKGEWAPYKYVGRAENFYRYTGFSRDVQLSFTIYAHSRAEMLPLYQKLNKLAGTTAPTYAGNGYMLGNFVKLTVGTYLSNVPGIINSINLKPSFEAGWDINRTMGGSPIKPDDNGSYVGQIPRMIEVDLSFTPIHQFTPQYGTPFINNTPSKLPDPTPNPAVAQNSINAPSTQLNTAGTRSSLNAFTPNDRNPIGVDNVAPLNDMFA